MVGPHRRWLVAPRRQCQVKGRGHRVPLSTLAMEIIESHARALGERVLVWPAGEKGRLMDGKTPKRAPSSLANPIAPWRIE